MTVLRPDPDELVGLALRWPRLDTTWDTTLARTEHVAVLAARLTAPGGEPLGVARAGELVGAARLAPSPWDTAFFGVAMGTLRPLLAPDRAAAAALGGAGIAAARSQGLTYLATDLDAADLAARSGLQDAGWRVTWIAHEITADLGGVSPPKLPDGAEILDATPADLPALEAATAGLEPYNWPEVDPFLPAGPRATYVRERLRSCVAGDFADLRLVLRWRGRVVGFHAGARATHPGVETSDAFSYERDTFVVRDAPPGLGRLLLRAALSRHAARGLRWSRGQVRLHGHAMRAAAERAGYALTGARLRLVWSPPG